MSFVEKDQGDSGRTVTFLSKMTLRRSEISG